MQELSSQFTQNIFHMSVGWSGTPSYVLGRLVVRHFGRSPGAASVADYLLASPLAYLGQKTLTFRFPNWRRISMPNYLTLGTLRNIAGYFSATNLSKLASLAGRLLAPWPCW